MDLILASTSVYRRELLARLALPFSCEAPGTDETAGPEESAGMLAQRLAIAKAQDVAQRFPSAVVVGSDQVAALGGKLVGKPGGYDAAFEQLSHCSGRTMEFYTGLAVVCAQQNLQIQHLETFSVSFRSLSEHNIRNYLEREQPFDCAGSFKCEGLGIALFSRMHGDDPSSLVGLPLIALTTMLGRAGINVI